MADCEFFLLNPQGHHFTRLLLHAINAVLLFLTLRRMTGATWRSLFVAAVFGLHPLRVESVAWVAERKDVLSTLFGLLTLLMYTVYAERFRSQNPKFKIFYGLALMFFACSLMSKPMLVTLPFVLLLLDFWPLNRFKQESACRLTREKIPFFLLAAASSAVTFAAQKHGGAMVLMAGIPFGARCEKCAGVVLPLPWQIVLAGKSCHHLSRHGPLAGSNCCPCIGALLLGVSIASIVMRRSHPYLATGWFWFLGTLIPVIGLVAVGEHSMADRYTYFPQIGVLILITWGVEEMTRRWRYQTSGLSAMSAVIIVTCILLTLQNLVYWKTSETLFRHVIAVTSDNYSAYCNLGNALMTQGRLEEALNEFQTAAKLKPDSPEKLCNVGVALAEMGRMDEAIVEFQDAVRLNPDYGLAHQNLGMALERKGQLDQATREYEAAVNLMPDYAPAHNSLGVALAKKGRLDDAVTQFKEAVRLDPSLLAAQDNLKMALELKGH